MSPQKTGGDESRETLSEAIADALGACLVRGLKRHPENPEMVRAAFRDWKTLNQAKLYQLVGPGTHQGTVKAVMARPALVGRQHGRLLWSPELIQQDIDAERANRNLPRAGGAPRLFLSYRWSYDDWMSDWVEEFAAWLFNRGYDIVYDRDPRHMEKGFSSDELLALLPSCSQLIAIVTDGYQERICNPSQTTPVCQEFALAPRLYLANKQPTLLGLWIQGEKLNPPFSSNWIVDYRDDDVFLARRDKAFPVRKYQVTCARPDGSVVESDPIERLAVRPLVHQWLTERPGQRVMVRDVTSR